MKVKKNIFPFGLFILLLLSAGAACSKTGDEDISALRGTVEVLSTKNAQMAGAIATQSFLTQYLLTRPPMIVTPVGPGAEPTPYRPVLGDVLIENGRCCVGGPAGELLTIAINLEASSPLAEVSEMRLAIGAQPLGEESLAEVSWEPFTQEKEVAITVPLNWSTSFASVQFRDAAGNLSIVYHDEIAVEGLGNQ
jgi:hypothetical protein